MAKAWYEEHAEEYMKERERERLGPMGHLLDHRHDICACVCLCAMCVCVCFL